MSTCTEWSGRLLGAGCIAVAASVVPLFVLVVTAVSAAVASGVFGRNSNGPTMLVYLAGLVNFLAGVIFALPGVGGRLYGLALKFALRSQRPMGGGQQDFDTAWNLAEDRIASGPDRRYAVRDFAEWVKNSTTVDGPHVASWRLTRVGSVVLALVGLMVLGTLLSMSRALVFVSVGPAAAFPAIVGLALIVVGVAAAQEARWGVLGDFVLALLALATLFVILRGPYFWQAFSSPSPDVVHALYSVAVLVTLVTLVLLVLAETDRRRRNDWQLRHVSSAGPTPSVVP